MNPPNRRKCSARKSSRLSKGARGALSNYPGWDDVKVALEGQVFELSPGPQGIEGRILQRRRRR
jgi:hypothetical protein